MSAQKRQAALIVALDEAVGGALSRTGVTPVLHPLTHNAMRAALVDGLGVLARELGLLSDDAAPTLVRQGVGEGSPHVQGRCPSCGSTSLFLAKGGHVTCSLFDCDNPCAADEMLSEAHPAVKAAPPARDEAADPAGLPPFDLPQALGEVIDVHVINDIGLNPPVRMFRADLPGLGMGWVATHTDTSRIPQPYSAWEKDEAIGAFERVVVVPEKVPAALQRIQDAIKGQRVLGCVKTLQAVEFAAREALKALDGEAS